MRLLAIYPQDGLGTECEPDDVDCGVPTNATISLRFDRFLNPLTANRQAIRVYSGDPASSGAIPYQVTYDPVERVVQYRLPPGYAYEPNALYRIELVVPAPDDEYGVRAFDGAPLADAGDVPLAASFFTGPGPVDQPAGEAPSCAQIVEQVFLSAPASCGRGSCHSSLAPQGAPHGLWLDSGANFSATAIERVARQTELGDRSGGIPLERPARFGVRMPLVMPGSPGGSYLMYKLMRDPRAFEPCSEDDPELEGSMSELCRENADACVSAYPDIPLADGTCLAPPEEELTRLREWFVRGEPMPIPRPVARYLGLQQLRAVSRFIAAGADCAAE